MVEVEDLLAAVVLAFAVGAAVQVVVEEVGDLVAPALQEKLAAVVWVVGGLLAAAPVFEHCWFVGAVVQVVVEVAGDPLAAVVLAFAFGAVVEVVLVVEVEDLVAQGLREGQKVEAPGQVVVVVEEVGDLVAQALQEKLAAVVWVVVGLLAAA